MRLFLLEKFYKDRGVRFRSVRIKSFVVENVEHIYTVGEHLALDFSFYSGAGAYSL